MNDISKYTFLKQNTEHFYSMKSIGQFTGSLIASQYAQIITKIDSNTVLEFKFDPNSKSTTLSEFIIP